MDFFVFNLLVIFGSKEEGVIKLESLFEFFFEGF